MLEENLSNEKNAVDSVGGSCAPRRCSTRVMVDVRGHDRLHASPQLSCTVSSRYVAEVMFVLLEINDCRISSRRRVWGASAHANQMLYIVTHHDVGRRAWVAPSAAVIVFD
jgi:hypothetical protein